MHSGRRFTLQQAIYWTRRDIYLFTIVSIIPTALYYFFNIKWLVIPWVAIAVVGTVFYLMERIGESTEILLKAGQMMCPSQT